MQLSDVVRIALIFSEDAKRYAKKLAGSIDLSGKADKKSPAKRATLRLWMPTATSRTAARPGPM